jgi:hypothetical protein
VKVGGKGEGSGENRRALSAAGPTVTTRQGNNRKNAGVYAIAAGATRVCIRKTVVCRRRLLSPEKSIWTFRPLLSRAQTPGASRIESCETIEFYMEIAALPRSTKQS